MAGVKFEDLTFRPHRVMPGSVQAEIKFPNGFGASVVGGTRGLYGDGRQTFELAVLHGNALCYSTRITNDVIGWQTKEQITALLRRIRRLKKR